MTAPPDDTTTDLHAVIAELRAERDAAVAREVQRDSDYAERAAHQGATVEVLQAMAVSPDDPRPVFELIVRRAHDLCDAYTASLARVVDGSIVLGAYVVPDEGEAKRHEASFPRPVAADTMFGRAILAREPVQLPDVAADQTYALREGTLRGAVRAQAAVPLMRDGDAVGAINIIRRHTGEFSQAQTELLQVFAAQAVIAITSAETYRALEERTAALAQRNSEYGELIDQQSATIDLLKVMAATPGDAQPVFRLIVERAQAFCDADQANLALLDGEMLHLEATTGSSVSYPVQFPRPVDATSMFGRAIIARDMVQTPDVRADPDHFRRTINPAAVRAVVAVPLLRSGAPAGAIVLARNIPGEFSATQVELLRTFAEQAVIAITSAETYRALQTRTRDLQETLEYQTAISDVLKAISRSTFDLQPVLDTVAEKAAKLCDAEQAAIYQREGGLARLVANSGFPPEYEALARGQGTFPLDLYPQAVVPRAIREGRTVHIHDVAVLPGYGQTAIRLGKQRTSVGVPLLREGEAIGAIVLARQRVEPFTDRQIELVSTFADQAVIAIENTRLMTEQREALEQQTATAEVLAVINASPGDLVPVFDAILDKAHRICNFDMGSLATYDGTFFRAVATRGYDDQAEVMARTPYRPLTAQRALLRGDRLIHIPDTQAYPVDPNDAAMPAFFTASGFRACLMVPLRKDGTLHGFLTGYRKVVGPFSEKQIALLENFAAQAVIAIENARLMTEQREALEQQTATAEVLQVINTSKGDLAPVFEAILDKAMRLCEAACGGLFTYDGEQFQTMAALGVPKALAEFRAKNPPSAQPGNTTARLLETRRTHHMLDRAQELDYQAGEVGARAMVELGGARSMLNVPLLGEEGVLGYISLYRQEVRPFSDRQIALLESFAAQAVIAMENARLLTETREALEQQTATAEVLGVINSNAGDLAPVFDAILEKAHSLCGIAMGSLELYDGQRFRAVAVRGLSDAFADMLRQGSPASENPATRPLIDGGRLTHIRDLRETDYVVTRSGAELDAARTLLCVPLRREGTLLGMIASSRKEVRPFADKEIALLENFAAQAVIAMENARLLNEQREALEQQTATAAVLQVINASPGNLAPVFDTILAKALRLCEAAFGSLVTYDGEHFQVVATRGMSASLAKALRERGPLLPSRSIAYDQIVRGADIVHIPDIIALGAPFPSSPNIDQDGARTTLFVALRGDDALFGAFVIFRKEVRLFSDKQIALLKNFAAQAVIAMENARLLDEIRQRQEELRVTFENMGDGVAMFDEKPRLVAWNRHFQEMFNLPDDLLEQHRTYEEHLRFLAARGDFGSGLDTEEQLRTLLTTTDQPNVYERTRPDGRVLEIRRNPVPDGGFVLIFSDITERKRSEEEIRAARDAAEAALRDLKAAQANLIQAEKMASLGQLTAGIAHEIKNPLNFVNNFAELSGDLLDELNDAVAGNRQDEIDELRATLQGNLAKITEHGRRADAIVRSMLEHSRGSSGERRMVDLNALIDEALNLAYHGARAQDQNFNITLERDFGAGIAPIEVNPQDMTRVFLNLFANGFYATTKRARNGGAAGFVPTLKVTTRDAGEAVEAHVRDNGTGIPNDIRDKLFQPFVTTKPTGEGTGLGLSITYDIVTQQHGGSIGVDSRVGEYSEFVIRLPRSS